MDSQSQSMKECITYGSIVSFLNDFTSNEQSPAFTYDSSLYHKNYFKKKKENNFDFIISRYFLYTQGIFNEFCELDNFENQNDIKKYYYNTLFMVLPSCEYDAMAKFKNLIKDLKNEILMDENPTINNFQILDFYLKFKQEIQANLEKSAKLMKTENNKVNFNDCVQFLHLRTGKFLSYRTYDEYLKTYIELTDNMSKNTIFRFTPAFVYQTENSTNVFFDLTIQIACGEKKTRNEKFISNIRSYKEDIFKKNKILQLRKKLLLVWKLKNLVMPSLSNERAEYFRVSFNNIFYDNTNPNNNTNNNDDLKNNLMTFSKNTNLAYKNFGKKLLPKDNYIGINIKSKDYWKLIPFSNNFLIDNLYIHSLDYFCIQNNEKNIFIYIEKNQDEIEENTYFVNFIEERKGNIKQQKLMKKKNSKILSLFGIKKKETKDKIEEEKNQEINIKNEDNNIPSEPWNIFNDDYNANLKYDLKANSFEEKGKNFLEPYSLFKFEIINNNKKGNEFPSIDILSTDCYVRIISVFFNKVLSKGEKNELLLINNIDKDNPKYNYTLFRVEKVKDRKKIINNETNKENNDNKENSDEESEEKDNEEDNQNIDEENEKNISKNDYIKLKSKVGGLYLGIRINNRKGKDNKELVLTKSISDLTKFKLNFLEEEDKYELHFFEQLLWSLKNILSFFKEETKNKYDIESSYEQIQHILITLEKKIKMFRDNRHLKLTQERKFDFLKIIEYFDIVDTLINLFIANWFNEYKELDYDIFEERISEYLKKKNENKDDKQLVYKQLISRKILKILTLIFDLDKSFLNKISSKLLYFLMFVGRDDKCTKFLVHILKDNRALLISLCPTNIDKNTYDEDEENESQINSENNEFLPVETYKNIKKCLKRIIDEYNHLDIDRLTIFFSSVFLFFKLMNCLIIYNNKPFKPFYDYYFDDLNLLEDEGEFFTKPDCINNPILIDFFLKNGNIYAKKEKFFVSSIRETKHESYEEENNTNKNSNNSKIISNNSPINTSNNREPAQFKLIYLIGIITNIDIEKYHRQIIFAKLVSLNLFFYSNLALCNEKFKDYLKSIFNIKDIINNYLSLDQPLASSSENPEKNQSKNLNNDLKCSLVQLINYLYFRVPYPFWEKINLFKKLKSTTVSRRKTILNNLISKSGDEEEEEKNVYNIIYYTNSIIDNNINTRGPGTDPFLIFQIFECSKYTLRYLYTFKNNDTHIETAFTLMSKILKLLDKYIGISKDEKIKGNLSESLNSVLNDQLNLKEDIFLVNDKFLFLFQKFKKKMENTIRNKEVKNLKELFKDLLGKATAKEDKGYLGNIITRNLKRKSMNILKQYNPRNILLEMSINSNKEQKTIINEIMYMISTIFLEFLKYIETLSIEELGINILEIKKDYNGKANVFEKFIIEEIIKTNNENYEAQQKVHSNNSIRNRYIEFKESSGNKYINKFKKKWNISDNISNFFFKFLQVIDNDNLINIVMQIIYNLNNQRKIYYRNVCNYVIFEYDEDFEKFLRIKDLFLSIFENIENINLIKRLDKTSYGLFNELNKLFESLIKKLFDENKWRGKNNILKKYDEIKIEENSNTDISIDFEIESLKFEENPNEINTKNNSEIKIDNNNKKNKKKDLGPYLSFGENSKSSAINLLIAQQTLYNLGFITIINNLFKYVKWIVEEQRDELKDELYSIELILISIYKLIVLFIHNNSKHKKLITDKLYLYIYPLKFKNKSENLLYFIGYFLLNLVSINYTRNTKNLDKTITILDELNNLDWINCKSIIPYFLESIKIFIQIIPQNYTLPLFQIINKIYEVLMEGIENKNCTNNDIISLVNILEFAIIEQDKRDKEENRNPILTLEKLIELFMCIIKILISDTLDLSNLKYSKILILVTNLIYNNINMYRNDFLSTKKLGPNLVKSLFNFSSKLKLTDSLIYTDKFNNNIDLKNFNEFIGLSIPKLYFIIHQIDNKRNFRMDDRDKNFLNLINKFYQIILDYITPKRKNSFRRELKIFLTKKKIKEIDELSNLIKNSELKFMKLTFGEIEKSGQSHLTDDESTIIDIDNSNEEIINTLDAKDERQLEFGEMWNKIQLKIIYRKGFDKFNKIVKEEISTERKRFIKSLINYCEIKKVNTNNILNLNFKGYHKSLTPNISFYNTYSNYFIRYYGNDLIKYKNELYFFYWSNIFLMEYNAKDNTFDENKTQYNKEYFNRDIVDFTLKQFNYINYSSSNYENLLFLKFFNSYLCELDEITKEKCLIQIVNSKEAENLFNLIRYILDKLYLKINEELEKIKNRKEGDDIFKSGFGKDTSNKGNFFPSNLFENDLDEYILSLDFLTHFSENNEKTKDYLRYQNNNNSKNHNFIIILAGILEIFISDENPNNKYLIEKYFNIIIKIIECITKCCNRSSKENQDCIIKETKLLKFTKFILDNLIYREKKYFYDEYFCDEENKNILRNNIPVNLIECLSIGLDRKQLSYLKFKLLLFLSVLTVGRSKSDKIYDAIHQEIDFFTLINVIVETYKEILIEKNCQKNHESLNFDEKMLGRFDNPEYKNLLYWDDTIKDDNFIIFEIGTYSYILINIFLENISRPSNISIYNEILKVRNQLMKDKCKEIQKNIFDGTVKFFKCFVKIFKKIILCTYKKNANEDFSLPNSFALAYKFYFDYTPEIEILFKKQIIKYYVKLSPVCKCLTREMKEEFNQNLDRTSTKTKITSLFNSVEYFQFQLNDCKNRMDLFERHPIFDLIFNQYNFYMDIFYIMSIVINLLIFCSYYRINDDKEKIKKFSENFKYRYGLFYRKENIYYTEKTLFYFALIETILGCLILINYFIIRIPYLTFYKNSMLFDEYENVHDETENKQEKLKKTDKYYYVKLIISVIINIFFDGQLLYYLILFILSALSIFVDYRFLIILLIDVIKKSRILSKIAYVVWESKTQLLALTFLYYLIAYYIIIFIYLFIPDQVPDLHCLSFMECFFTLCDQSIKNSNGLINYLDENGLYTDKTLWGNIRFYIDNIFAIFEYFIVLQVFTAIIVTGFTFKTKEENKIEKDKTNKCFICGLKKSELSKYYNQLGFNGHIKLDHYLWNYMFAIFNVMKKDKKNLISFDKIIYDNYRKKIFKTWIPFKTCKIKYEEDMNMKKRKY